MRKLLLFGVAFFALCATSVVAGPGKRKDLGTSNNGPGTEISACLAGSGNCANFSTAPFETVDGFQVFKFGINFGDGTTSLSDVFQIPATVTAGATLSMTLNTLTGDYGAFACDNSLDPSSGTALDSLGDPLTGPCTATSLASVGSFLSETDSGNTATFKFGGAGLPSSWTFYTTDGNLASLSFTSGTGGGGTTVPEPSSIYLLTAGTLLAAFLVSKSRHRAAFSRAA